VSGLEELGAAKKPEQQLRTILPGNHLIGVKTQPSHLINWLVLVNRIKQQPNNNTINLNDT